MDCAHAEIKGDPNSETNAGQVQRVASDIEQANEFEVIRIVEPGCEFVGSCIGRVVHDFGNHQVGAAGGHSVGREGRFGESAPFASEVVFCPGFNCHDIG